MSTAINKEAIIEAFNGFVERKFNELVDMNIQEADSIDKIVEGIENAIEWREEIVSLVQEYFESYPKDKES